MIKRSLTAALLVVFSFAGASAETIVQGSIEKTQNWNPKNSPYVISGTVTVEKKGFLTLYPGTTVRFKEGARLLVKGVLYSKGMPQNPVRFIPDDGTSFYEGIRFESPYKNTIEWSIMIRGGIISEGSNVSITNNYMLNSTGIQVLHLGNVLIKDNYFFNNTYGVYVDGKNVQYAVMNNTFNKNRFAVYVKDMPGGKAMIRNNNFFQNQVNLTNYSPSDIDCKENYWGAQESNQVERLIFDRKNNNKVGKAVYEPFAKAQFKLFEPPVGFMALVKQYLTLKRPDEDPERIAIGGSFIGMFPFTPESTANETQLNLGGSAEFTANITGAFLWGMEARQFFSLTEQKENYDYSLSMTTLLANLYYYIGWQKNVWLVPYVKLGQGLCLIAEEYRNDAPVYDGSYTKKLMETNYALTAGAGLEFFPSRNISLKLEGLYMIVTARQGAFNTASASLGVMFYFDSPLFINK